MAEPDSKVRGKTAVMLANHSHVVTASDERALRAGVQLLDSEIRWGRAEPGVQAVPLVSANGTVLLGAHLRPRLRKLEPRLAKAGFRVVDTLGVLLDPITGSVSVPDPCFEYDESVLRAAAESSRSDRAGGSIPTEPLDVKRWVLFRQPFLADLDSEARRLANTVPILRSRAGTLDAGVLSAMGRRMAADEVRWVGGAVTESGLLDAIVAEDWEPEPEPEPSAPTAQQPMRVERDPDNPNQVIIHMGDEAAE